jgi:hypothetical protein
MIYFLAFLLSIASAGAAGAWRLRASRGRDPLDRFVAAALPPALCLFAWGVFVNVYTAPMWEWNNVRLAPAFAIARGFPLYPTQRAGATLSAMYSPLSSVAYLPATLGRSPTAAMTIAGALTLAFYFLPALPLFLRGAPGKDGVPGRAGAAAALAFAVFGLVSLDMPSLSYSATRVHADAPALGLSMASCAALALGRGRWRPATDLLSCALAALSVLAKQTALPVVVVLPLWVLLTRGLRPALIYALEMAACGALLTAATFSAFDLRGFLFSAVAVPGRYPWKGRFPTNLMRSGLELLRENLFFLVTLAAGAAHELAGPGPGRDPSWRRRLAEGPWYLVGALGLANVPFAILGHVKEGGVVNCFTPTTYFLAAASLLMIAQILERGPDASELGPQAHRLLHTVAMLGAAAMLVIAAQTAAIDIIGLRLVAPRANRAQVACDYIGRHPGAAYFPDQPLAHLMAEGKMYHSLQSLHERQVANFPVGREQLLAHVPPGFALLCFSSAKTEVLGDMVRPEFFPDYSEAATIEGLGAFACYRKPRPSAIVSDRGAPGPE